MTAWKATSKKYNVEATDRDALTNWLNEQKYTYFLYTMTKPMYLRKAGGAVQFR